MLEIPIVGATRTPETLRTVPSAVTVFDRPQLQALGVDYLYQLLALVPGMSAQRSGNNSMYATASVRGQRIGVASDQILLLIDGQKAGLLQNGGIGMMLEMPLFGVERVEFIRGPGAAVYGSNAMLAVINITTLKNNKTVAVQAGSHNLTGIDALAYNDTNDPVRVNLQAHLSHDIGDEFGLTDAFNNAIRTRDKSEKSLFKIQVEHENTLYQLNAFKTQYANFYVGEYAAAHNHSAQFTYHNLGITHTINGEVWQSKFSGSYGRTEENLLAELAPEGALSAISSPTSNQAATAALNVQSHDWRWQNTTQWSLNKKNHLSVDFEWSRTVLNDAYTASNYDFNALRLGQYPIQYYGDTPNLELLFSRTAQEIRSLSVQWQHTPWDSLKITLGGRYDDLYDLNLGQFSPRAGLVYTANEHHTVKLLYGNAFKAPTTGEKGFTTENSFLQGNPDLHPETVNTTDLIWAMNYTKFNITLGVFENHFKDTIREVLINNGQTRTFINASQPMIQGLEVELAVKLPANFILQLTASHILQTDTGTYLEADNLGAVTLFHSYGNWNSHLSITYEGERYGPSRIEGELTPFKSYVSGFGKIQYQLKPNCVIFFTARNLNSEQHFYPPNSTAALNGIPSHGIEGALGVKWNF